MHELESSPGPVGALRRERDPQGTYEADQATLLELLLEEYPGLMTYEEARIARVRDPEDREETDRFEIAVWALARAGLIRRQGGLLVPVRPARQMAALGFTAD